MYYDLYNHPKYEYAIYCKVGTAKPYIIPRSFKDLDDILKFLGEQEENHYLTGRTMYVDNDFYQNKFSMNEKGTYFKVLMRPVSDWEVATYQGKTKNKKNTCKNKTDIIYLKKEKKRVEC